MLGAALVLAGCGGGEDTPNDATLGDATDDTTIDAKPGDTVGDTGGDATRDTTNDVTPDQCDPACLTSMVASTSMSAKTGHTIVPLWPFARICLERFRVPV